MLVNSLLLLLPNNLARACLTSSSCRCTSFCFAFQSLPQWSSLSSLHYVHLFNVPFHSATLHQVTLANSQQPHFLYGSLHVTLVDMVPAVAPRAEELASIPSFLSGG